MQSKTVDTENKIVRIDGTKCIGCGGCKRICRPLAVQRGKEYYMVDEIKCTGCGECVDKCPADAIYWV